MNVKEEIKNDLNKEDYMLNRRTFVKMAGVAGAYLAFGGLSRYIPTASAVPLPGGSLNPLNIPKYVTSLVIPPSMPRSSEITENGVLKDYYEIAVRQFTQQILPTVDVFGQPLSQTTVWSYGSVTTPGTFNYPAFTVEAMYQKPVRVKWINDLKDASGDFLPHLLPVDSTLHWANPPGGPTGRDMRPPNDPNDPYWNKPFIDPVTRRYTGPVPIVVHLHGGHTSEESDGFPEAWFLPVANNIPAGFATVGSEYENFKTKFQNAHPGVIWDQGAAVFEYDNNQKASTLWYHDHALGMTRNNVQAGPAGFYLLRGGPADLNLGYNPPSGIAGQGVNSGPITEIPIAIQDRTFNADGSLFYPDTRAFFDGFGGPYFPNSDIAPIHNPEFFGNTMVVNGNTWPKLTVEQRRYRFRFLNGTDSRFIILKMSNNLPFYQIGADGGFLPKVQQLPQLLIGPAERADVIVDFTKMPVGTQIILQNIGPDSPFGGGNFAPSDPATTGQVMRFDVVAVNPAFPDTTMRPTDRNLILPAFTKLGAASVTRQVSLNELNSAVLKGVGPRIALLGTVILGAKPAGVPLEWKDPTVITPQNPRGITENPTVGATEVWEIYNFTADAHPIHIHEIMFQVQNRQSINGNKVRNPELWESGDKDTVTAYPGEITRVKAMYDRTGLFVWHCHILSHEDNEMMRPYEILPP